MKTDVLIIGSGIAGLSLALKLSVLNPALEIWIVTKAEASDCNTRYAQGGIAAVMNHVKDSYENHILDTINCGKGLCNKQIVEMVVKQAPDRIHDLIELGAKIDLKANKDYHLALEGGHSMPRVVHHKDKTGMEIERVLLDKIKAHSNIHLLTNALVIDLLVQSNKNKLHCHGVQVFDKSESEIWFFKSKVTVLASGGCGQVYTNTTNPEVASGDGYAMAYRAGAKLKNMRFMQFHPTSLYASTKEPVSFLISEALRGFGAYIVDGNNNRFLYTYDSRGELATRDIISSAIYKHMLANDMPFVYLDLRHLDLTLCKKEFPQIFAELKNAKLNPQCDLIPITPSAHYQCGGVVVDKNGQSSIRNLYALGEVACTGLHGANRLASNSLLEALVFAHNAAHKISRTKYSSLIKPDAAPTKTVKSYVYKRVKEHTAQLKNRMMNMAFEENPKALEFANAVTVSLITSIEKEIKLDAFSEELLTLRNLAQTANLIMADKLASYDIVKQI